MKSFSVLIVVALTLCGCNPFTFEKRMTAVEGRVAVVENKQGQQTQALNRLDERRKEQQALLMQARQGIAALEAARLQQGQPGAAGTPNPPPAPPAVGLTREQFLEDQRSLYAHARTERQEEMVPITTALGEINESLQGIKKRVSAAWWTDPTEVAAKESLMCELYTEYGAKGYKVREGFPESYDKAFLALPLEPKAVPCPTKACCYHQIVYKVDHVRRRVWFRYRLLSR